jgi:predicted enzyme related to lactoylglutathione lyase
MHRAMSNEVPKPKPGTVGWMDLTVPNAKDVAAFYRDVAGHELGEIDMGGYSDYVLTASTGAPAGGVCHARGENANMPPVWMVYFTVVDLEASLAKVEASGGKIRIPTRDMGGMGRFAVIEDPAGAIAALYQTAKE